MQLEIVATNAKLTNEADSTTIWARDSAGNEVSLVLNERLTKRLVDAKVSAELESILATLVPVSETLREKTDAAEASLREVHNTLFSTLRSEIGIRKPREPENVTGEHDNDPDATKTGAGFSVVTR